MKKITKYTLALLVTLCSLLNEVNAQIAINENGNKPDASAMLDVSSTDKGILIPRMSSTARENISNPTNGLMVFDSTTNSFWYYYTTNWIEIGRATLLADTDGDTRIALEKGEDDDLIRFDLAGTEFMRLDSGRIEVLNTGNSIYIGQEAGRSDNYSTDRNNVGIGTKVLQNNTKGGSSVGIGFRALEENTEGFANIGIGYYALHSNTTGESNVGIGYYSLGDNTSGRDNTGVGYFSLGNNTTGAKNTAFGYFSLGSNETGNHNTSLGHLAGSDAIGSYNIYIGNEAGRYDTSSYKLYIEPTDADSTQALIFGEFDKDRLRINGKVNINGAFNFPTTDGLANQVLSTDGNGTVDWITNNGAFNSENGLTFSLSNNDNFVFGTNSLDFNTGSENKFLFNQAIGAFRAGNVTNGAWNTNNQGNYSFAAGRNTEATATNATAFGENVRASSYAEFAIGYNNTDYSVSSATSASNTDRLFVIGNGSSTSSLSDALIVYKSGDMELDGSLTIEDKLNINLSGTRRMLVQENSSGGTVIDLPNNHENTFLGEGAGRGNDTGTKNTFIGYYAGFSSDEGVNNTICGYRAGQVNAYGNNNCYYGVEAGLDNLGGVDNVFMGYRAGAGNEIGGSRNVFLGFKAGENTWFGSNNVFLGYQAGRDVAGSNRLYIENSSSNNPLIYGEFDNNLVRVNGTLDLSNGSGDDVVLLRFNTERSWQFEQGGSGANNTLFLKSSTSGKNYNIISADETPIASYRANNGGNNKVGINKIISTNSNTLEVNGSASKSSAGDWLANSDARLKKNIQVLNPQQTLEKLLNLQGVTYEWNDNKTGNERPEGIQYGFTAQNIQTIFPELVTEDSQGFLQTSYGTYDAMYVEALRALKEENEAQKQEIEALKAQVAKINQLEVMLEQLQAQVNQDSSSTNTNISTEK